MKETNNKMIDALLHAVEIGDEVWSNPYLLSSCSKMPISGTTKKPYNGLNTYLIFAQLQRGYTDNRWYTFNASKKIGATVKKGEHGYPVLYWNFEYYYKDGKRVDRAVEGAKCVPFAQHSTVFNAVQIDGLKDTESDPIDSKDSQNTELDKLLSQYANKPEIREMEIAKAYYSVGEDRIYMPEQRYITDYEHALYHELVHSTGHKSRLDRLQKTDEAIEEMIAEFGSFLLSAMQGDTSGIKQSAAYIRNWSAAIKDKPTAMLSSISAANKAVKYILGNSEVQHG